MGIISQKQNPFEHIKFVTIIKITGCHVEYHEGGNPYIQITIGGLVLEGIGDVVYATIEDSADYGDDKRVKELENLYTPNSLHWIESQNFHFIEDEIYFWQPTKTLPVAVEDVEEIEKLFLRESSANYETKMQPDVSIITTLNVGKDMDQRTVVMSGFLEHIKITYSKRGDKMAFARLHDQSGYIDLIIFPSVYENFEKYSSLKSKINATGTLQVSNNSSKLIPTRFDLSVG